MTGRAIEGRRYRMEGIVRLIQGDCLEVMDKLIIEGIKVDAIITDPPYGTTACKWDSVVPFDSMWVRLKALSNTNTPIILFGSQPFTSTLISSNTNDYSHQWIWNKKMSANPLLANKMPLKNFEDIVVFYKQYDETNSDWRRVYFKQISDYIGKNKKQIIAETNQGLDHCFRIKTMQFSIPTEKNYNLIKDKYNIGLEDWFLPYDKIKESANKTYNPQMEVRGKKVRKGGGKFKKDGTLGDVIDTEITYNNEYYPTSIIEFSNRRLNNVHPTQKPVALMEYLIKTYTNEGETVLDFTMGSGTTGVACKNLKRKFIGIEKDAKYFGMAKERIENKGELF